MTMAIAPANRDYIVRVATTADAGVIAAQRAAMCCKSQPMDHVTLAASDEERPLYEALGFQPTTDMKLARGSR